MLILNVHRSRVGGNSTGNSHIITCDLCNIQHVGTQTLREQLNVHRCKIIENKLKTSIVVYFNVLNHSFCNLKIQLLETVDDKASLTQRELSWIKTQQTIYTFGLNENILGLGNVSLIGTENARHFSLIILDGNRSPLTK